MRVKAVPYSNVLHFSLPDDAATESLGIALAMALASHASDGAVLYFRGDLGAGKTSCVRSALRFLGVQGLIRSPTYTLIETYEAAGRVCVHIDLYRLGSPAEAHELGIEDCIGPNSWVFVEWPEQGGAALPPVDLEIGLSHAGSGRRAGLAAMTARGEALREFLRQDSRIASYVSN